MTVKITTRPGNVEMGCCVLFYRDHTLSISTIAQPPEILVFNTETKEDLFTLYASAEGVRQAMSLIDAEVDRDEDQGEPLCRHCGHMG
jgi:hypothetical protein